MKRGFLLPEGWSDLNDALKLKQKWAHFTAPKLYAQLMRRLSPKEKALQLKGQGKLLRRAKRGSALPPVKGEVTIPEQTSVPQLAALLGQKPFRIIADLVQFGVKDFWRVLGFRTCSRIARKYGFIAKKPA